MPSRAGAGRIRHPCTDTVCPDAPPAQPGDEPDRDNGTQGRSASAPPGQSGADPAGRYGKRNRGGRRRRGWFSRTAAGNHAARIAGDAAGQSRKAGRLSAGGMFCSGPEKHRMRPWAGRGICLGEAGIL